MSSDQISLRTKKREIYIHTFTCAARKNGDLTYIDVYFHRRPDLPHGSAYTTAPVDLFRINGNSNSSCREHAFQTICEVASLPTAQPRTQGVSIDCRSRSPECTASLPTAISKYHLWCTPPLYSTSHKKPIREPAFQVQSQTPCILGTTSCVLLRFSRKFKEAYKREYLTAGVSRPGTTPGPCYKRELDYRFQ